VETKLRMVTAECLRQQGYTVTRRLCDEAPSSCASSRRSSSPLRSRRLQVAIARTTVLFPFIGIAESSSSSSVRLTAGNCFGTLSVATDLRWISGYVTVKEPRTPPRWWHQDW
jgi:hypothetical protein